MTPSSSPRARVGIVGLGQQGAGIAALLGAQGYDVLGGVDIGDKVGRRVADVASGARGEGVVHGSVTDLIAAVGTDLDAVILAAAISLEMTLAQARELLAAGINVLSIQPDLFEPTPEWADELDAIGAATGASLVSTGVQDTWWVQMPAVAAASTNNIRSVQIEHLIDLESIAPGIMKEWGIGASVEDFPRFAEIHESMPPILGAPLRVAAKALGFEPGPVSFTSRPLTASDDRAWAGGDTVIPAGAVIGTEEVTSFMTDAGVEFRGFLRLRSLEDHEQPTDILTIDGDPRLRLEHSPFPGQQVTNIALVARIPDIIAAPGGVHSVADLGPARYLPPVSSVQGREVDA